MYTQQQLPGCFLVQCSAPLQVAAVLHAWHAGGQHRCPAGRPTYISTWVLTNICLHACPRGISLVLQALNKLGSTNAQVAILGTGKAKYEAMVKTMGAKNPKFKGVVKFSAPLAHTITAGADFILVPSRCVGGMKAGVQLAERQ